MKALLINGSPHKEGCTFTALSEISNTLKKTVLKVKFFTLAQNRLLTVLLVENAAKQVNVCLIPMASMRLAHD